MIAPSGRGPGMRGCVNGTTPEADQVAGAHTVQAGAIGVGHVGVDELAHEVVAELDGVGRVGGQPEGADQRHRSGERRRVETEHACGISDVQGTTPDCGQLQRLPRAAVEPTHSRSDGGAQRFWKGLFRYLRERARGPSPPPLERPETGCRRPDGANRGRVRLAVPRARPRPPPLRSPTVVAADQLHDRRPSNWPTASNSANTTSGRPLAAIAHTMGESASPPTSVRSANRLSRSAHCRSSTISSNGVRCDRTTSRSAMASTSHNGLSYRAIRPRNSSSVRTGLDPLRRACRTGAPGAI